MAKIKLATTWLEACAGCHMSFLDIDERIVELLNHVELTSSPITDLKHPPESGVDVGIITGGIGNVDELEEVKMMRERCKILIALGAAAFTLSSMYGFDDADSARIASGVVAGVGFLGAGVIFRGGPSNAIAGLTTAASIWVTAGIGLAAGAGLYGLSVMIALLAFIVLRLPHMRD